VNWLSYFGGATGLAGIIFGASAIIRSFRKDRVEQRTDEEKLKIALADADTSRVAEILDGYKEQVAGLQAEVKQLHERVDSIDTDNRHLRERNEMQLQHIARLELMIPNPPGAPTRPWLM